MNRSPTFLRVLAAAALVVAVGGCELFKPNAEATAVISNRVVGKPISDFFDRYGPPTKRVQVGTDTTLCDWASDMGTTRPGPEGQDDRVCRLRLTVDKAGKVSTVDIVYDAQGKKSVSRCGEIFAAG